MLILTFAKSLFQEHQIWSESKLFKHSYGIPENNNWKMIFEKNQQTTEKREKTCKDINFVWFDYLRPSQQLFSYVRMVFPGLNLY